MKNLDTPKFGSDAEEAEWWDAHMEIGARTLWKQFETEPRDAVQHAC